MISLFEYKDKYWFSVNNQIYSLDKKDIKIVQYLSDILIHNKEIISMEKNENGDYSFNTLVLVLDRRRNKFLNLNFHQSYKKYSRNYQTIVSRVTNTYKGKEYFYDEKFLDLTKYLISDKRKLDDLIKTKFFLFVYNFLIDNKENFKIPDVMLRNDTIDMFFIVTLNCEEIDEKDIKNDIIKKEFE